MFLNISYLCVVLDQGGAGPAVLKEEQCPYHAPLYLAAYPEEGLTFLECSFMKILFCLETYLPPSGDKIEENDFQSLMNSNLLPYI